MTQQRQERAVYTAGFLLGGGLIIALLGAWLLPMLDEHLNQRKWERRELLKGCTLALDDITTHKMTFECPLGTRYIVPRHWRADLEMTP